MRRTTASGALLLTSLAFALVHAPSPAVGADEGSLAVEHVTTSPNTGGTRYRPRNAPPAIAPAPAAPAPVAATPAAPPAPRAAPVPAPAPKPAAAPIPVAKSAAKPSANAARAAQTREGATVRKRPALDGQVLARLSAGTSVEVETELRNDEDAWWYVSTPTVSGWIAARELSVN